MISMEEWCVAYSISERYICDKLTSSVNDLKCSNAVVSEFMNEVMI